MPKGGGSYSGNTKSSEKMSTGKKSTAKKGLPMMKKPKGRMGKS